MTRSELIEKIKERCTVLEQWRAASPPVSGSQLKALENEIKELQAALAASKPKRADKPVYISGG